MAIGHIRSRWIAGLTGLIMLVSVNLFAQHEEEHGDQAGAGEITAPITKEEMNPGLILMEHILDKHEFHFADYNGHAISIPLPIILYAPDQGGLHVFMSSKFHHGHEDHNGFRILADHENGKETIVAVGGDGKVAENVAVYDFSMTRNVVQMLISLILLLWVMISVAKRYRGEVKAPSGLQNAIEPLITFIRDDVAKPNLGLRYQKFMPFLLTIFFFILFNNLVGLIPGAANVTGNITVTIVLGIVSFVVILFTTNKHFWSHIFNPPVPGFVKPVLVLVEFLGIFIKPMALIIRLFANMVAGHMIIACLILMIFIFANLAPAAGLGFSPVSILFTVFIYAIELLVAFIQAYIFANLTAVFIGLSMEGEQFHEEGSSHAHH